MIAIAKSRILLHTYLVAQAYTIEELLEEANRLGFAMGRRAFYDWVNWGLLGEPAYPGKGRGDQSRWSPQQRELFFTVLNARREVKHIAVLCNIPVWWWLRRGDAYVAIPQVRRALHTWGRAIISHSPATARKAARQLLQEVQYPEYPRIRLGGRREFVSAVAQMIADKQVDQQKLAELITPVFDRKGKGTPRGPEGVQLNPEGIAEMIVSRYEGIQHLAEMTDSGFEAARTMYLSSRGFLLLHESALLSDPGLKNLQPTLDRNHEASTACHNLAALLGALYRMDRQARLAEGSLPFTKWPEWQEQLVSLFGRALSVPAYRENPQRFVREMQGIVTSSRDTSAEDKDLVRRVARGFDALMRLPRKKQTKKMRELSRISIKTSTHPSKALFEEMLELLGS